jgi:hypothetical protein
VIYFCCGEKRRSAVRAYVPVAGLDINGIDYLEVVDHDEPVVAMRQRVLRVYFVKPPAAPLLARLGTIAPADVRISGGERTTGIVVESVTLVGGEHLEVTVNQRGDFSTYTLTLAEAGGGAPLAGMDPALSAVDFSFKVECPSPFDCADDCSCVEPAEPSPVIDYLAKDYDSFRQLLLDRLSALAPSWRERNPADLGITLVELLAYTGDYLSYRQDAIGTEGYLGTARRRTSVRRHARMLDYAMHDGCNARVWIQVRLRSDAPAGGIALPRLRVADSLGVWTASDSDPVPDPAARVLRTQFSTAVAAPGVIDDAALHQLAEQYTPVVFEAMHSVTLYPSHNELHFHTWSDDDCCLPKGATRATLAGSYPDLHAGDVLVFKEVLGPLTGSEADADLAHRHAVRLTSVYGGDDLVTGQKVTEVAWGTDDALPFALCLSSVTDAGAHTPNVSVALGNIVLADHGMTFVEAEDLGTVPEPDPALAPVGGGGCHCTSTEPDLPPARFRPRPLEGPITRTATVTRTQLLAGSETRARLAFDPDASAASAFDWDMERVLPAIRLSDDRGVLWMPKPELLSSDSFAAEFVVEMENDGRASLRFGDDENGMSPGEATQFVAAYRVGNGTPGNIGAEAIVHVTSGTLAGDAGVVEGVTNPMAARGGTDPETLEQVRQYAPAAFRVPQRAVTPDDYARMAERHPEVQRAEATLRWTGSWYTVFLAVDRLAGRPIDPPFVDALRRHLERYRMAGHDLEIDGPSYVPLALAMLVCVESGYFRSDVLAALRKVFSNRTQPDGTLGFFHADRFTFGQGVHLSELYAAAQGVAGVRHVEITTLQRLGETSTAALDAGVLAIHRLEIARLDNDPNFPDRGIITFTMSGGR